MPSLKINKTPEAATDLLFVLLLAAIFLTELIITLQVTPLIASLGIVSVSLLDAAILILVFTLPLWFFLLQPLSVQRFFPWKPCFCSPQLLLLALLTIIFLAEFSVMLILQSIMTEADGRTIAITDACFAALISAPPLWWLIYGTKTPGRVLTSEELLVEPLRLFALLVFMVFLSALLMDFVSLHLSRQMPPVAFLLVDASLSTLLIAVFLWWLLILPLKRRAQAQNSLLNAVYTQAVDAIVSIDAQGTIQSFNPAAEKLFGYAAAELIGTHIGLLFADGQQGVEGLLRSITAPGSSERSNSAHETDGRCRDGSLLTIDVSVSNILLEGQLKQLIVMRDVSDRKKMEESLRTSEERFSLAVSGSNDGIWDWDIKSGAVYYCPRFKALLGYQHEEIDHTFASFEKRLHPDDSARVMEAVRLHLEENHPYDVEYRLLAKSGEYMWFRARGQTVRDSSGKPLRMAGSISDITGQKRVLEALRESEIRFRQIFEQSEDAIFFFKPGSGSIIDVNATAERLFGYAKAELQGAGLELVAVQADLARLVHAISTISMDKGIFLDKVSCLRKDGSELMVSVRGKVMTLQNVAIIYCTFRDVTERLQMEQEAREIQAKLIQVNKMTSLGLMVSAVAHEINNPNNFIMANAQLLKSSWNDSLTILREYYRENGEFFIGGVPFSELEARSPELFDGILEGSARIVAIIDNLKKFARNDFSLDESLIDVNQVVSSAVAILHFELKKFTNHFHLELAENIPLVKGSSQQLGQIIINLLMNACQSLADRECRIWLTTGISAGGDQVILSVRDEGQGMDTEKSRLIMEPFFTTKLDSGGTGLGLSICRSIARDHSWTLDFTTELGKGSEFTVRIPLTADKEHPYDKR